MFVRMVAAGSAAASGGLAAGTLPLPRIPSLLTRGPSDAVQGRHGQMGLPQARLPTSSTTMTRQ
jgi:hypothetical protein